MTRIPTLEADQAVWWQRPILQVIYRTAANEVKKLTGKATIGDTIKLTAHRPRLLWGLLMMESGQLGSHALPAKFKALASLRVSTLVGCPY